jgi:hypothetical protein
MTVFLINKLYIIRTQRDGISKRKNPYIAGGKHWWGSVTSHGGEMEVVNQWDSVSRY